jgi:hypothetical protein
VKTQNVVILGSLITAAFFLLKKSNEQADKLNLSNEEIDAAARALIAETSLLPKHNQKELAGIFFVGLNRAKARGWPEQEDALVQAFTPPGQPLWNGSMRYRERFQNAARNHRFEKARAIVKQISAGKIKNPIGERKNFVHPTGMPRCGEDGDCRSDRFRCINGRCLPIWSVVGTARYEPIDIGQARFS